MTAAAWQTADGVLSERQGQKGPERMTMTPIGPDEQVDESEVMNVTDKATGETTRMRRRKLGLWGFKNHAFSNDFVQGAVRNLTLVKAALGALSAFGVIVWAVLSSYYTYVIAPQQERVILAAVAAQITPMAQQLADDEKLFHAHLLYVSEQRALFPTRIELKGELTEIKAMIQRLEDKR